MSLILCLDLLPLPMFLFGVRIRAEAELPGLAQSLHTNKSWGSHLDSQEVDPRDSPGLGLFRLELLMFVELGPFFDGFDPMDSSP